MHCEAADGPFAGTRPFRRAAEDLRNQEPRCLQSSGALVFTGSGQYTA